MNGERAVTESGATRVMLDATGLGTRDPLADEYVIELARAAGLLRDDLVVVCRPRDAKLFKSFDLEVHRAPERVASEHARRRWVAWGLPRLARKLGIDVIHSPHDVYPSTAGICRAAAIHHPLGSPLRKEYRKVARLKIDSIVASNHVAQEIRSLTSIPANRVHVSHRGVSKSIARIPEWETLATVSESYGFTEWITVVASDDSLESLTAFCEGHRRATEFSDFTPSVVVTGLDERVALEHTRELLDAGFDLRIVNELTGDERIALFGGSLFTVVLDDSARTGRALVESMMCGATVLAPNTSFCAEFGGTAIAYSDCTAPAMEIAITELLSQPELRQSLATAAVTQANRYSWNQCLTGHREAWNRARARG